MKTEITSGVLAKYGWKRSNISGATHHLYSFYGTHDPKNETFCITVMDSSLHTVTDIAFVSRLIHIVEGKEMEWTSNPGG